MAKSSTSEKRQTPRARQGQLTAPLAEIVAEVSRCRVCCERPEGRPLPHEPRPVLRVSSTARMLIAGQAPGTKVHASGLPFTDASGERLRDWLGIDPDIFYDANRVAIVPMGFCFPGQDARKADLPPRRECRATWHDQIMAAMPQIETIFVIGNYARDYHFARLGCSDAKALGMTDTVQNWRAYANLYPRLFPLPHPSWRNTGWLKRNPWFEADVLPALRAEVRRLIGTD